MHDWPARPTNASGGRWIRRICAHSTGPSFDQHLESDDPPAGAQEIDGRIIANDAFSIASPEYNGSMTGLLKNSIDRVSRYRPQPFKGHQAVVVNVIGTAFAASPQTP